LAVDANGRFDLQTAVAYAHALAPYGLRWYEEPGDPLDFQLQAKLASHYPGPWRREKSLFSARRTKSHTLRATAADRDILQFDCALSYGLVEYLRITGHVEGTWWSPNRCIPHGGHQMSLNIRRRFGVGGNESYPGIFQPFGGFADGITGRRKLRQAAGDSGVGFEAKDELFRVMKPLRITRATSWE